MIGDAVEGVVGEVSIGVVIGVCVETLADEEAVAADEEVMAADEEVVAAGDVFVVSDITISAVAIISATASSKVRFVCLNNTRIKVLPEVNPKDCSVVDFSAGIVEY